MNQFNNNPFANIPPVVKNLLILNGMVFLALNVLFSEYANYFALHNVFSDLFRPVQWVSHMFMHGDITHLLFNMFGLWMFGMVLERILGPKKFLAFYLICGLGAASLYMFVDYIHFTFIARNLIPEQVTSIKNAVTVAGGFEYSYYPGQSKIVIERLFDFFEKTAVGASGAIFGIFVAFGLLFPEEELMLLFFPVPVKAKYFIPIMIVLELYLGAGNFRWDNIAHFAHLGGALFGYILIKIWLKDISSFN